MSLEDWGWDERWAAAFAAAPGKALRPARIVEERRGLFFVVAEDGEFAARVTGAMRHKAGGRGDLPAIGDWAAVEAVPGERAVLIRALLPRRTKLSRQAAGEGVVEQVIAANLDTVFITTALNRDFNPRRLERFLAVCRESGAEPVLLLNKLDACPDPVPFLAEAEAIAGDAAVAALSAKTGAGLGALSRWVRPGRTVGFVGASGVGKSTLVNRLLGEDVLAVRETRGKDERGRHTTTHRELFRLPGGGILLDTPGMREMKLWDAERGVAESFDEIEALGPSCRFSDCRHDTEPGCAVKAAVDAGSVAAARLAAWRKLRSELDAKAARVSPADKAAEKRRQREMNKDRRRKPEAGR